jgi:hypothetical protein
VSPLPLLKIAKALACLKSPPRGWNGSPELLQPAQGFLTVVPPSLPVDSWPFPAIEFIVAPSSSLPNFGDPGATLAHASLNSGDLTAAERSGAARSRLFSPWSDPLRPIWTERLRSRITLRTGAPCRPGPPVIAQTLWRWACSVSALFPSVADTPWTACQRSPARACALGRRCNLGCGF